MQNALLFLYVIILIVQIVLLIWCTRHYLRKRWIILYLLEIASAVAAFLLMRHFDNLPGYGMMPGLSYFGETIFSLFALYVYGAMLVITVIVNILVLIKHPKT